MSSATPSNLVARVSRRELALNRYVWLATGGMFALFCVATAVIGALPLGMDQQRLFILSGCLAAIAIVILRVEPPPIGSPYNHIVLGLVYVGTTGAMVAFQPGGSAAIGAAMFIGPLTAVRLLDRREIAAHYLVATICLMTPAAIGIVDRATVLAGLTVVPALWVLGACCVIVLEAAEAQGEELEGLVRRDPLTGVGNRRLLSEKLTSEIKRHSRAQFDPDIVEAFLASLDDPVFVALAEQSHQRLAAD